jgi:small subunit ribosomal protein S5
MSEENKKSKPIKPTQDKASDESVTGIEDVAAVAEPELDADLLLDDLDVVEEVIEEEETGADIAAADKARAIEKKKMAHAKRPPKKTSTLNPDLEERVVAVNRVAKVVKGGRRFSFSVLMVVGDKKGNVGYGLGKAREVPEAIKKATMNAQKHMIHVPITRGTIPHSIIGEYDAGKILFRPACEGTGVKAAGAARSILELAGIKNVLTKSLRGNNPHNVVKATFKALQSLRSVKQIADARGKDPKTLRISNKSV